MKSDAQIKHDVEAELDWEPAVNAPTIGVEVRDGIVTLAGHVRSYVEKLAAEKAAQCVAGVLGVAVELDVHIPGLSAKTDAEIAKAARDALHWHTVVPDQQIKVRVEDGFVMLTGELEWGYQRQAAENAVRNLTGIRGVTNQIRLVPTLKTSDIQTKIESALRRNAAVDAKSIRVAVKDGTVTLDGSLHSLAERRLVEDAVWAAPGVEAVVDHLQVAP